MEVYILNYLIILRGEKPLIETSIKGSIGIFICEAY